MSIYANPFLSLSGQKERLSNVKNTLVAAITGKGVKSNTGVAVIDKPLSAAASNPFITALPVAAFKAPAAAAATIKAGVSSLTPKQALVAAVATPIAIGAVASNPKLLGKAAKAPSELASFGSDVGSLIAEPSIEKAKEVVENSPIISYGLALGTAAAVGGAVTTAVINAANTRAVKKNTEALLGRNGNTEDLLGGNGIPTSISMPSGSPIVNYGSIQPYTPETVVSGREASSGSVRRARKKKPVSVSPVRIQFVNQNNYIEA